MTEAKFQTEFNRWCKYNWHTTDKFELKITNGKSIRFDAVKPHQRQALLNKRIIYKIPDVGQDRKPFDSFCMNDIPGWVVIMFHTHGCKTFYMIEIIDWLSMERVYSRKSVVEVTVKKFGRQYKFA